MHFSTAFCIALGGAGVVLGDIVDAPIPQGYFSQSHTGIGSWFRANNAQDHTNGKSWCGFKYYDTDAVFAPPLSEMGGATYNTNPTKWRQDTKTYCGLEAEVTDPTTGKSKKMYIGDAFDQQFVKSPGSIDIMISAFKAIHDDPQGNKNDVIKDVKWKLTGKRNTYYAAQ